MLLNGSGQMSLLFMTSELPLQRPVPKALGFQQREPGGVIPRQLDQDLLLGTVLVSAGTVSPADLLEWGLQERQLPRKALGCLRTAGRHGPWQGRGIAKV